MARCPLKGLWQGAYTLLAVYCSMHGGYLLQLLSCAVMLQQDATATANSIVVQSAPDCMSLATVTITTIIPDTTIIMVIGIIIAVACRLWMWMSATGP